jgi:diguanylate cyclase (GGDEF)-like protein
VIESELTQATGIDSLTGLANRRWFVHLLEKVTGEGQADPEECAVLCLDLDHFKDVNHTFGHPVGDLLLQAVADRLQSNTRPGDTVARFGGDEFAVLAPNLKDPTHAELFAQRLIDTLGQPFRIEENDIYITTSVGLAFYDSDSPDAESVLSHSELALYGAKAQGRQTFQLFTDNMDREVRSRFALTADLRKAIFGNQLLLSYQPQVDLGSGSVIGLEALLRWRHPTKRNLTPSVFMPVAEESGLISPLHRLVLRDVCCQIRRWLDAGLNPPCVAINLSGIRFRAPRDLERDLEDILAEYKIVPARLELELTETAFMATSRENNNFLRRLRAKGFRLSIDDFGTGYSSLLYLRRLPADRIKIAQEFIVGLTVDSYDAAIVRTTLGLAHALGLSVLAEGVETAEQAKLLEEWGCRDAQGFYFARPTTPDEITELLRSGRSLLPGS